MKRELHCENEHIEEGAEPDKKQVARISVVAKVYERQMYMYENRTRSVPDRIVSIRKPFIRIIIRGKAATPTGFGAKLDLRVLMTK